MFQESHALVNDARTLPRYMTSGLLLVLYLILTISWVISPSRLKDMTKRKIFGDLADQEIGLDRRQLECSPLVSLLRRTVPARWHADAAGRAHTGVVRITIRVRPGSARPGVGGTHDGALVVRVSERAVDGRATAAALVAVAAAFGVRRRAVTLVAGASNRTKVVDVAGAEPTVLDRLLEQ